MDNKSGKTGEDYTAEYLRRHFYRILARNFSCRFGEIDIVALRGKYIVFVEVKTRKTNAMVSPVEAVTKDKQRKLRMTADFYLLSHQTEHQPRFDVAAVRTEGGKVTSFDYIKNAF